MDTIDRFLETHGHLGWVNMEDELYDEDMATELNDEIYVWNNYVGDGGKRVLHRIIKEGVLVRSNLPGIYEFFAHYSFNDPTL